MNSDIKKELEKSSIVVAQNSNVTKNKIETPPVVVDLTLAKEILEINDSKEQKQTEQIFKDDPTPLVEKMPEAVSLILHEDTRKVKSEEKIVELPNNLPLLPFESSPHIWPFSKYKDVFHNESLVREPIQVITVMPRIEKVDKEHTEEKLFIQDQERGDIYNKKDKEVIVKKVQLSRQDESLVFLAGVMLLVIILILGYMYSNGRL